jgi:ATP-binding cassette, subfamily B, bacterial PglK
MLADVWSVLDRQQRRSVVLAQLLSILLAFSTVVGIASIAPFFAVLGDPSWIERSAPLHWLYDYCGFRGEYSFETALGLAFVAIVVSANLLNVAGTFVMIRLSYRISAELQSVLFEEYLSRPYVFHTTANSALLFNKVIHETNRLTKDILQNGLLLVTSAATAVLIIISVLAINPAVAVAMVASLALGYALIYFTLRNWLLRAGQIQTRLLEETAQTVNETFGAIKEILVLRVRHFFLGKFERTTHALATAQARAQIVYQNPRHLMECVTVAGLVSLALLSSGHQHNVGSWLARLSFMGFAAYRLLPALQQTFAALVRIRAEQAGFATIAPDLRQARARKRLAEAADPAWRADLKREIRLHDVSFRYAPDRPPALDAIDMCIPARAAVALVGANGSGKTTAADLIAGLLTPGGGGIEIDGIVLDDANRCAWQSCVAYVPQNIYLLDTSIAANIALGVPADEIDHERLRRAARRAQLDAFVAELPDGFNHVIGERGVRLSGGQRQRIGIARALYKDASVLIMDEATNALDGMTEKELVETVMQLRGLYTIVLIAHRLATVQACDLIFEFDRGRIAAAGSYAKLLRDSDSFRRLARVS